MSNINLLPAIREIEKEIQNKQEEFNKEIAPYKESLTYLRQINTACEQCGGEGKKFRRACAEDEGEYYPCKACHGTGRKEGSK